MPEVAPPTDPQSEAALSSPLVPPHRSPAPRDRTSDVEKSETSTPTSPTSRRARRSGNFASIQHRKLRSAGEDLSAGGQSGSGMPRSNCSRVRSPRRENPRAEARGSPDRSSRNTFARANYRNSTIRADHQRRARASGQLAATWSRNLPRARGPLSIRGAAERRPFFRRPK